MEFYVIILKFFNQCVFFACFYLLQFIQINHFLDSFTVFIIDSLPFVEQKVGISVLLSLTFPEPLLLVTPLTSLLLSSEGKIVEILDIKLSHIYIVQLDPCLFLLIVDKAIIVAVLTSALVYNHSPQIILIVVILVQCDRWFCFFFLQVFPLLIFLLKIPLGVLGHV